MQDALSGTWKLIPEKSNFDPNHRPLAATMVFVRTAEGHYLLTAEGVTEKGETCQERPVTLIPDGKEYPVPNLPGLVSITTLTNPNTLTTEIRRQDGSVVGGGTYIVSSNGSSMTVTNSGYDTQFREFKQSTTWDRQ